MTDAYRPSQGVLRYYKTTADWDPTVVGAARYAGAAGFDNLGMTWNLSRILRTGTIGGSVVEPESLPGAWAPSGTFAKPFQLSIFDLGLIGNLYGASSTPAQQDAPQTVYLTLFDANQSANDLSTPLLIEQDITGTFVQRWWPVRIKSAAFEFAKNAPVAVVYTPLSLQESAYEFPTVEAGTADEPILLYGDLSKANRDLVGTARTLNIQVTSVAAGPPIVLTCKADLGAVASYGALTFDITCGLTDEGFPQRAVILDSNSPAGPGTRFGESDDVLYAFCLDGTNAAALDEYSYPYGTADFSPTAATEPEMVGAEVCVSIDDERIEGLNSVSMLLENDWALTEGGLCGRKPPSFKRTGNVIGTFTFNRDWLSDTHVERLRGGAALDFEINITSGVLVDGTGSHYYRCTFEAPNCLPDENTLKALQGGATDDTEEYTYRAHASAGINNSNVRLSAYSGFATL